MRWLNWVFALGISVAAVSAAHAATVPIRPEIVREELESVSRTVRLLREENLALVDEINRLRAEVARLEAQIAGRRAAPPATQSPARQAAPEPAVETPRPAVPPTGTTYVVRPGDTLSGISKKFYRDSRYWAHIYEANRDQMDSPENLIVGMELVVPSIE